MTIEEGFFPAGDGVQLFYRFQGGSGSATENPLLLLHGHGEHSGRYIKFFSRLADLHCPMATFDLRGSGQSGGRVVYVSRFEDYLKDLSTFLSFLGTRYSLKSPVRLFGHSLGGLIATAWARENSGDISKLILSSPLFGIPKGWVVKKLVGVLNEVLPGWVIKNPVRPPFLTHDPGEVEKYRTDPLIRRRITVRLVHEMLRYVSIFENTEVNFSFPVYILMAGQDLVVDPQATRRFFERLRAPDKKLEVFEGFFHEIFNERDQEKVFERLEYFLGR